MLNAYMVDSIIIKIVTYDEWGEPSEVETTVKGRIEYKTRMVRNMQGEQVVSSARIMLDNRTLNHRDKLYFDSRDHAILNIGKKKDFSNQYLEVDVT